MSSGDGLDIKILELLEADGRLTNSEIARKLHVSEALVRQRLRKLFDSATAQLGVVVDFSIVDIKTIASVRLAVTASKLEGVVQALADDPATGLVLSTTGPFNVYLIITAKDQFDLAMIVETRIRPIDGLQKLEVSIISEAVKYDSRHSPNIGQRPAP